MQGHESKFMSCHILMEINFARSKFCSSGALKSQISPCCLILMNFNKKKIIQQVICLLIYKIIQAIPKTPIAPTAFALRCFLRFVIVLSWLCISSWVVFYVLTKILMQEQYKNYFNNYLKLFTALCFLSLVFCCWSLCYINSGTISDFHIPNFKHLRPWGRIPYAQITYKMTSECNKFYLIFKYCQTNRSNHNSTINSI